MKVAIAGGGAVGLHIADELGAAGHDVLLIEVDPAVVDRRRKGHEATWILGDACDPRVLSEAGIGDYAVMVAATGDDEDNLVVSLLAKQEMAVPKVVARVNHPKNAWMFNESWGVDVSVSAPQLLTALVTEAVSVGSLVRLLNLEGGAASIIEITLADDSPAVGHSLSELALTRDATIVAVVRANHVLVPRGDTVLAAGDEVLALVTGDAEDTVTAALVGAK